jgi:hypothetical protein
MYCAVWVRCADLRTNATHLLQGILASHGYDLVPTLCRYAGDRDPAVAAEFSSVAEVWLRVQSAAWECLSCQSVAEGWLG